MSENTVNEAEIRAKLDAEYRSKYENEQKSEDTRRSEIRAIGKEADMKDEAERAVETKMSIDAFRKIALQQVIAAKEIQASKRTSLIGLTEKQKKQFSISRAILGQCDIDVDNGYERELSQECAKNIGKKPDGIYVPMDVLLAGSERTFDQTTGAGSNLIATNLLAGSFIDILRNASVIAQTGVFMMPGLVGNVAIPRQTGSTTAYWFNSESAGITTPSNPIMDQVALNPTSVGDYCDLSRSLLKQSTPYAEQLVRNDIAAVIALAIDAAALKGTGQNAQPRGITQTSGIGSGNWTTANTPSWDKYVDMETAVDIANALNGEFVYVMGSTLRGASKKIVKATGQMGFLMEGGRINDYRVVGSNQLAAGECIFGKFSDLIIGMWGGLDLKVNDSIEALDLRGAIRIRAIQDVNIAVRRPKSFVFYSNPSAS